MPDCRRKFSLLSSHTSFLYMLKMQVTPNTEDTHKLQTTTELLNMLNTSVSIEQTRVRSHSQAIGSMECTTCAVPQMCLVATAAAWDLLTAKHLSQKPILGAQCKGCMLLGTATSNLSEWAPACFSHPRLVQAHLPAVTFHNQFSQWDRAGKTSLATVLH